MDSLRSQPDAPPVPRGRRILVVEDQLDVRQMLVTALEIEGHHVDGADNARDGLKRLQESRYNLVLSDYAMPGGTGTWMLHEAAEQGLLEGTEALIITAHPGITAGPDVEVITKPLDLDLFLQQVRRLLAASDGGAHVQEAAVKRNAPPGVSHKVELVLYVSSASPSSILARRNLERLLARFDQTQVKFTVCDLGREPLAGDADRIAFTPTLVKRFPEPKVWVLGNLREAQVVGDLLRVYGVDGTE